ncbi:MAG: hypothetical protein HY687_06890 [Chloroflexi bacterium]|nr:hypothetical protein [Chloroflexota bacterium]
MKKQLTALGLALALGFILFGAACAPQRQARDQYISGTSAGDAETLNWILAADSASLSYAGQTLDSLATYNNKFEVQLRHLAKPVEVSPDGLVYTITIRDDLHWSDGVRVTAEDYVYTLKSLMFSDWLNFPYKGDWQEQVGGQPVFVKPEVVNATTFRIVRQTVDPEFFDNALIGLTPYPKHIAQKYEGNVKAFTEAEEFNKLTYTGNLGPYKFKDWVRNDKYVVARNPEFFLGKEDGAPFFTERIIKIFGTPAATMAALEAGDITAAGIDPAQVAKFKSKANLEVYTTPDTGYLLLAYNMRDNGWEGFRDPRVRQAFSVTVSKKQVVEQILLGFGEPAFSFLPKPSPWYTEEGVDKYGVEPLYSKDKARETLIAAGYGARGADGSFRLSDKGGKPLKLVLATNVGNKTREDTAALIQQELSDLGVEVELKLVPWPTLLNNYLKNKVPSAAGEAQFNSGPRAVSQERWDMIIIGFSSNPIAPSGQEVFLTSSGGLNFWGYNSAAVDALFKRVKSAEAVSPENRKKLYAELSRVIAQDQPVNFLAFQYGNTGIQKRVKGIEPGINMGYNFHRWFYE